MEIWKSTDGLDEHLQTFLETFISPSIYDI